MNGKDDAIPESATEVQAGVPIEQPQSAAPIGEVIHDTDLAFTALADGAPDPNSVNIANRVAETYNAEQKICGIFRSRFQLYVACGVGLLMAAASILMGVFIPPAIAAKKSPGGEPVSCDMNECMTDASHLAQCLTQVGSTADSMQFTLLTICPGTIILDQPMVIKVNNNPANFTGHGLVRVVCSESSVYQKGSPCILEAPADQAVFLSVYNADEVDNTSESESIKNSTLNDDLLHISFVDITFKRPAANDALPGIFKAANATIDFLSCSFLVSNYCLNHLQHLFGDPSK